MAGVWWAVAVVRRGVIGGVVRGVVVMGVVVVYGLGRRWGEVVCLREVLGVFGAWGRRAVAAG